MFPTLFTIGNFQVSSYYFFYILGGTVGAVLGGARCFVLGAGCVVPGAWCGVRARCMVRSAGCVVRRPMPLSGERLHLERTRAIRIDERRHAAAVIAHHGTEAREQRRDLLRERQRAREQRALDDASGHRVGHVFVGRGQALARLWRILPATVTWRDRRAAWSELLPMCRFGGLSLLGSICTMSAMWFANLVLVAQPGGYAALGVFNAAERWRQLLLFLPASFSPVILTTLSNLHGRKDPDAYRRLFGLNLAVSVAVVVVPSIGIMLCAGPAMGLFGDEYRGGWMTLVILSASSVVVVLNNLLGQILVSRGAVMGRFVLDVLLAAVLALASWQLIPIYREQGMALGSLIAFAVTAAALAAATIRFMRPHRSER